MKIKVWIVSEIDCYGGDMLDCLCTFRNYAGVKVFTSKEEAADYAAELDKQFATDSEIDECEIEVEV